MAQNTSHAVMQQRRESSISEMWNPIPSAPGYEASSLGRIRRNFRILSPSIDRPGYRRIKTSINGEVKLRMVHALVCEAFNGPKPDWADVCAHNDGSKDNNIPENLRWATYKENSEDMINHGTRLELDEHPRATMNNETVKEIRAAYLFEKTGTYVRRGFRVKICEKYGITMSALKDVLSKRSWKDC